MASTYSDLKIELIGTGDQSGTWGNTTNTNLGTAIEQAITGTGDVTFASADLTLTLTDTNASQTARNLRLNLGGTSGGARNLIVPSIEKQYIVYNGTADTVTVKNASGTGVAIPTGKTMVVFNNATDVVDVTTHASSLTLGTALAVTSGGTGQSSALVAGGVIYGASITAAGVTSAGTSGQPLLSGGASAPSFGTLGVAGGGTGATSQTAYAVLAGGTTSTGAYQSVSGLGSSGQVLMSNGAGALPSWQTVSTKAFPTGTRMAFQQTAAPTGWTKDTTAGLDNAAMRIVTGSASSGGSVDFTTAFASQTPTGTVSITSVSGSAGATTLTTPQIPSHSHPANAQSPTPGNYVGSQYGSTVLAGSGSTGAEGGSGSHDHPFSFSSGSGSFSGSAINLAVKYYDFIIASID